MQSEETVYKELLRVLSEKMKNKQGLQALAWVIDFFVGGAV